MKKGWDWQKLKQANDSLYYLARVMKKGWDWQKLKHSKKKTFFQKKK